MDRAWVLDGADAIKQEQIGWKRELLSQLPPDIKGGLAVQQAHVGIELIVRGRNRGWTQRVTELSQQRLENLSGVRVKTKHKALREHRLRFNASGP